jgi:hypothetical protein
MNTSREEEAMNSQISSSFAIQYAKQYRAEEIRAAERSRIAAQFRKQGRFAMFRRARVSSRAVSTTVTAPVEASAAA